MTDPRQGFGYPPAPGWHDAPPALAGRGAPSRTGVSFGLPVAVAGAALAVLGFLVLDWTERADFVDARHLVVDLSSSSFDPFTQLYFLALWLPLLVVTSAVGVCVTCGPLAARIGTLVAGIVGGLSLIGLIVYIETGHIGSDRSRADAKAGLVLLGVAGAVTIALGIGAFLEKRAIFSRVLVALLAALAATAHLVAVNDLFPDDSQAAFGAWAPAVGFVLLLVATAVPYRRPPAGWQPR